MMEVSEDGQNLKALSFLTLGSKYLNLVHNVLEETVNSGNHHMVATSSEIVWDEYWRETRWSDFRIIEPVIFNFYQGLELTLKGLQFLVNQTDIKPEHNITNLFDAVQKNEEVPDPLKQIIKKYVSIIETENPVINAFLVTNKITINQMYEFLRYPSDKSFENLTNYIALHYREEKALQNYKDIIIDIKEISRLGTSFYRDKTNTGRGGISVG